MPRGRHRHSPPLHRLLPSSAIAGVSVVCALGPWVFFEATVLRALAAAAAATAVVGAVVMRRWDAQAGKQVAELTRARASDEWRNEERVAELETDLEESRELRAKLEQRLRAKRAELAGLRNEHAALLRRYATAETERASALEGRRLLEIEAAVPSSAPALPPARSAEPESAPTPAEAKGAIEAPDGDEPQAYAVFSPEGAQLYRSALTALARFERETPAQSETEAESASVTESASVAPGGEAAVEAVAAEAEAVEESEEVEKTEETEEGETGAENSVADVAVAADADAPTAVVDEADSAAKGEDAGEHAGDGAAEGAADSVTDGAGEDEARERSTAADGYARVAGSPAVVTASAEPAKPVGRPPAGHFTVPTAVAVVPAAPARRPLVQGGFDFFGTQKAEPRAALDSVQNEDLADVVGQEALAVHKAETEGEFKDADARSQGVGQIIDLTAHDETEQIDVQGLRSAAS
ncbi:hypothetical protein [Streptomyces sp. CoH27]|uniref:hypothetical protein n=1 Tax=Streptomyces sp. CoH27 TaxID=2875763 RepID=UPI001CD5C3C3|nr:hypothetical protein [Streptomyces sp. CoH27]